MCYVVLRACFVFGETLMKNFDCVVVVVVVVFVVVVVVVVVWC